MYPICAIGIALLTLGAAVAAPNARVSVVVSDRFGYRLDFTQLQVLRLGDRKDFSASFKKFEAERIPYGTYRLRLIAPGFNIREQDIRVYQPIVTVRIGLSFGSIAPPYQYIELRGIVTPAQNDEVWVALMPIIDNGCRVDDRITDDGTFSFTAIEPGHYLLVVIRGTTVLHTRQISVSRSETISVSIPTG